MSTKQHFELLAQYNQWMNTSLYRAVATLSPEERNKITSSLPFWSPPL